MNVRGRRRSVRDDVLRISRAKPTATAREIAARLRCHPSTVRKHLHTGTPPQAQRVIAARMLAEPDTRIRRQSIEAHPGLLSRFAVDRAADVRARAAEAPRCPPAALARLAADESSTSRRHAALHPDCPAHSLRRLATDPAPDVRQAVAGHPSCSPRLIARLADDAALRVRDTAAFNANCPPEVLAALAGVEGQYQSTLVEVAGNPSCPEATLQRLAANSDPWISSRASLALAARGLPAAPSR